MQMGEINKAVGSEEDQKAVWNKLVLALGGAALAIGSTITYYEGKLLTGAVESGLSAAALFAAYKVNRKNAEV